MNLDLSQAEKLSCFKMFLISLINILVYDQNSMILMFQKDKDDLGGNLCKYDLNKNHNQLLEISKFDEMSNCAEGSLILNNFVMHFD